jgi:hypothetical protein
MNCERLQLSTFGHNQSVIRERGFLSEDVEHERNTFEAKHIISVGRNFNLKLRRFLLPIDNGSFLICGVFIELNTEFKTELLELFGSVSVRISGLFFN